jgi:TolA-binding protein
LVTVKGTVFTVSWDALNERFELRLRRGRVLVTGPVVNGGLELRAGQRLVVSLPRSESVISDEPPEAADGPPEALAPGSARAAAPPSGARQSSRRVAVVVPKATPGHRWAADLASGHWDRILAEVERDGVDATLENAPSEDLFALADAARYRRRPDLARSALLAQRERFPNSSRASDAIFLLGRVEESRASGRAAAVKRYDEYLARAPSGTYAAEALGRKMILVKELNGPESARPIAEQYLQRFPGGSYAEAARTLDRAP